MEMAVPFTAHLAASRYLLVSGQVMKRHIPPSFSAAGEATESMTPDRTWERFSFGNVTILPKKHRVRHDLACLELMLTSAVQAG